MERVIRVAVTGSFVTKDDRNAGVQGEANAARLHLTLSRDWLPYSKRIVWQDAAGEQAVAVLLYSTVEEAYALADPLVFDTPIPGEALARPGWCLFTVEGYEDGDPARIARTAAGHLLVRPARILTPPAEPTPTQAQQLQTQIDAITSDVTAILTDKAAEIGAAAEAQVALAHSWAAGGTGARQGEETDNAAWYAGQAMTARDEARDLAVEAGQATDEAVAARDGAVGAAGQAESARAAAAEARDAALSAKAGATAAKNAALTARNEAAEANAGAAEAREGALAARGGAVVARDEAVAARSEAEAARDRAESAAGQAASRVWAALPAETVAGPGVRFPDGAEGAPFEAVSLSGAWQTARLRHTGGNLFDPRWSVCPEISQDGAVVDAAMTVSADGSLVTLTKRLGAGSQSRVDRVWSVPAWLRGRRIAVSVNSIQASGGNEPVLAVFRDGAGTASVWLTRGTRRSVILTLGDDARTLTVRFYADSGAFPGPAGSTAVFAGVKLEPGDAASAWAPYRTETVEMTAGQPVEAASYDGDNVLWADAGETLTVTYRADIKRYVEKRLAETQALILEG